MFKFLQYNVIFIAKHTGHEENYTKISQRIITEGSTSGWRRVHIPRRSSFQAPPLLRALLWSPGAYKANHQIQSNSQLTTAGESQPKATKIQQSQK